MGRRRFVNLVVQGAPGLYSLRRIPTSRLFYPSTRAAEAAMAKTQESFRHDHDGRKQHPGALHFMDKFGQFPSPLLNLQPAPMHHRYTRSLDLVTLLGNDETKILTADNHGHTVLFDAASYSVVHFPKLQCSKGNGAMAVSINRASPQEPDSLYVLNLNPYPDINDHCFEVLSYGGFDERLPIWRPLPPPPFACDYVPNGMITSYTVVGGDTIYISSDECGTHAFDTVSLQWRTISSLWSMPFDGKAEYVPELKLWFGLSGDHPYSLCACDLTNTQGSSTHLARPRHT
uniref:DUF1618 domain-containing protein n=1 Tax=Oryza punctata TaxID=4537 RepID=A0A0E0MIV9_ORYPU